MPNDYLGRPLPTAGGDDATPSLPATGTTSAATTTPRERFERSKSPEDFLRWLNAYTNDGRRGDDELHALCSWAHSVINSLEANQRTGRIIHGDA